MEDRRGRLFDTLVDAISELRRFLDEHDEGLPLDTATVRQLERLTERYQRADDAVGKHVEATLKRSSTRPRR